MDSKTELPQNEEHEAPSGIHPHTLEQSNPWFVTFMFTTAFDILSNYGWLLVISVFIVIFLWGNLKQKFSKWSEDKEMKTRVAEHHKDPDKFVEHERAVENSRIKLQEEYERAAMEYAARALQREEVKRKEQINKWDKMQQGKSSGYKLNNSAPSGESANKSTQSDSKNRPKLTSEFNPLMGGGSCGWRPARRGFSTGG